MTFASATLAPGLCAAALAFVAARDAGAQAPTCVLRGSAYGRTTLVAAGGATLSVGTDGGEIEARPRGRGGRAEVTVSGSLTFSGTADVPFSLTRHAQSADGVALVPRTSVLANVGPSGDELVLDAELEVDVWARRVVVACSAARAGYRDTAPEPHLRRPRGPGWLPHAASLEFFSAPGGAAALTLEAPSREWLPLRLLGRRAGWARVSWHGRTGAAVVGWVPRSAIRPVAALPVAYSSRTQCPRHSTRSPHEPLPAVAGEPFVGRATIDVGQSVHAEPDGASWARVARADVFTVVYTAGSAWARVIDAPDVYTPGVCDHRLCHAWVPRSAVHALAEREVAR